MTTQLTLTAADLALLNSGQATTITLMPPVITPQPPAPPVVNPPVVNPNASSIYKDGIMAWPGDYSYPAPPITIDYKHTGDALPGETYSICVDTHGALWGAWQPYAPNSNFDRTGKTHLNFAIKPTLSNSNFSVQFLKVGDKPITSDGTDQRYVNVNDYVPTPAGVFTRVSIPLDTVLNDNGTVLNAFYKFAIQSHSGTGDRYFIADVSIS